MYYTFDSKLPSSGEIFSAEHIYRCVNEIGWSKIFVLAQVVFNKILCDVIQMLINIGDYRLSLLLASGWSTGKAATYDSNVYLKYPKDAHWCTENRPIPTHKTLVQVLRGPIFF